MPGLKGVPDFEGRCLAARDVPVAPGNGIRRWGANHSQPELQPAAVVEVAGSHPPKVGCWTKVGQHEPVMQIGAPPHQAFRRIRVMRQKWAMNARNRSCCARRHARVRGHFKGPQFEQAEASGGGRPANTACRCRTPPGAYCRMTSINRLRKMRSTSHGVTHGLSLGAVTRWELAERDLQFIKAESFLASSTRGACEVGPMNRPENR
jgi:hypothetical protein